MPASGRTGVLSGGRPERSGSPSAGSTVLDDADAGAPEAQRRAGGLSGQDADLVGLGAAQGRGRVQRDVGIIARAMDSAGVGLAGQGPRAGVPGYPGAKPDVVAGRADRAPRDV